MKERQIVTSTALVHTSALGMLRSLVAEHELPANFLTDSSSFDQHPGDLLRVPALHPPTTER